MSLKEDEFSIKVEAADDHLFWIRVVRSDSGRLEISDLKRSSVPDGQIAAALCVAAHRASGAKTISELRFLDIVPSPRSAGTYSDQARAEAALLSRVVVQLARLEALRVDSAELRHRGEKFDFVVALSPLTEVAEA